jgi:hypothetical protein
MKNIILLFTVCGVMASCTTKEKSRNPNEPLGAELLTTADGGGLNFSPMSHEDSNFVKKFIAPVYMYDGKPYTGAITSVNDKQKKLLDGQLKDGVPDGKWTFYYASGAVQIEGNYSNGMETGMWYSYYRKDFPKIAKYYNNEGYMLMRAEYYDNNTIKNYQNIKCADYGDIERRIQFSYSGELEYIDAERDLGKMPPAELNKLLVTDGLRKK